MEKTAVQQKRHFNSKRIAQFFNRCAPMILLLITLNGCCSADSPAMGKAAERLQKYDLNDPSIRNACLFLAAWDGDIEEVEYLVSMGANVNARDENGDTPLMHASHIPGNLDTVKCLVSLGANVNAKDYCHVTPLMAASYVVGNLDTVKYLVSMGADVIGSPHQSRPVLLALCVDVCAKTDQIFHGFKIIVAFPSPYQSCPVLALCVDVCALIDQIFHGFQIVV